MDTGICCRLKCFSEFRMCLPVWFKISYILHLDHQKKIRLIAVSCCMHKLTEMLDPPFCRCVRKAHDIIFFQGNAFYLDKSLSLPGFHIQVKTGVSIRLFSPDSHFLRKKISGCHPLFCCFIRSLGIHIDPTARLVYTDQIVFCFPGRIVTLFQDHFCFRNKKFSASACVLYVNRLQLIPDLYMGDKPVWPVFENTSDRIFIVHIFSLISFTIT